MGSYQSTSSPSSEECKDDGSQMAPIERHDPHSSQLPVQEVEVKKEESSALSESDEDGSVFNTGEQQVQQSQEKENTIDFKPSPETINFARLSIMLVDPTQEAVRTLMQFLYKAQTDEDFTKLINSKKQYLDIITKEKRKKLKLTLLSHEKKMFFPPQNTEVKYCDLEFSTMYKFLRHLDPNLIPEYKCKWGEVPDDADMSELAVIERIRVVRNVYIAHALNTALETRKFQELFKKLRSSVEVIEKKCGKDRAYSAQLDQIEKLELTAGNVNQQKELAKKMIDLEKENKLLQNQQEEREQVVEDILKDALSLIRETRYTYSRQLSSGQQISRSDYIEQKLEAHKSDDGNLDQSKLFLKGRLAEDNFYVETKAYEAVKERIDSARRVIIIGKPGAGKTDLLLHMIYELLSLRDTQYKPRIIRSPAELSFHWKPNQIHPEIIFVDDIFGKSATDKNQVKEWIKMIDFVYDIMKTKKSTILMISSRRHIFKDVENDVQTPSPLFEKNFIVDLNCPDFELSKEEKKQIFYQKVEEAKSKNIVVPVLTEGEMENICQSSPYTGFPFCAKQFAANPTYHQHKDEFFVKPVSFILQNIKRLIDNNKRHEDIFLLLLFKSIETETSDDDDDDDDDEEKTDIFQEALNLSDIKCCSHLFKSRGIKLNFTKTIVKKEILPLAQHLQEEHMIVKVSEDQYKFAHEKIKEAVKVHFANLHFPKAVDLMDVDTLVHSVRLYRSESKEETIVIDEKEHEKLQLLSRRMVKEILNGNVKAMCRHEMWEEEAFVEAFKQVVDSEEHISRIFPFTGSGTEMKLVFKYIMLSSEDVSEKSTVLDYALSIEPEFLRDLCLQYAEDVKSNQSSEMHTSQSGYIKLLSNGLMSACRYSRKMDIIEKLIDLGAHQNYCSACWNKSQENVHHLCPLEAAAMAESGDMIQYLLKKEACIPHNNWKGWKFIWHAAECNYVDLCRPAFIMGLKEFDNLQTFNISSTSQNNVSEVADQYKNVRKSDDNCENPFKQVIKILHNQDASNTWEIFISFLKNFSFSEQLKQTFERYGVDLESESLYDNVLTTLKETSDPSNRMKIMDDLIHKWNLRHSKLLPMTLKALMMETMHRNCSKYNICFLIQRSELDMDLNLPDEDGCTFAHHLIYSTMSDEEVVEVFQLIQSMRYKVNLNCENKAGKNLLQCCVLKLNSTQDTREKTLHLLSQSQWYKEESPVFFPLHFVVQMYDMETSEKVKLLQKLVELPEFKCIDIVNKDDLTPLAFACTSLVDNLKSKKVDKVFIVSLLDLHADIHRVNAKGQDIVHLAFQADFSELDRIGNSLSDPSQCDVPEDIINSKDLGGPGCLHGNVTPNQESLPYDSHYDVLTVLLEKASDLKKMDLGGRTYLHYCVMSPLSDEHTLKICQDILGKSNDENFFFNWEENCPAGIVELSLQLSNKKPKTAKYFIQKCGCLPETKVQDTLIWLAERCILSASVIEALGQNNLLGKEKPEEQNLFHKLADIGYCSGSRSVDKNILDCLLKFGFSVNKRDREGKTPLHIACRKKTQKSHIRCLIESGADPKCKDKDENSCIHLLIQSDRSDTEIMSLLSLPSEGKLFSVTKDIVNCCNKHKLTPLFDAVQKTDRKQVLEFFVKCGGDVNLQDRYGMTPFHYCIEKKQSDWLTYSILTTLKLHSNWIDLKDNDSQTYLNLAASVGSHSRVLCITKILENKEAGLKDKGFISDIDDSERTPAHNVVRCLSRDHPIVDLELYIRFALLLLFNVQIKSKDGEEKFPLDHCPDAGNRKQVLKSLKSAAQEQTKILEILEEKFKHVEALYSGQLKNVRDVSIGYTGRVLSKNFVSFLEKVSSVLCSLDFETLSDDTDLEYGSEMCLDDSIPESVSEVEKQDEQIHVQNEAPRLQEKGERQTPHVPDNVNRAQPIVERIPFEIQSSDDITWMC